MVSGKSLANPKSPIFGVKCLSRSILLALMSLCTICGSSSSWRYARPRAVPMQISDLRFQSSSAICIFLPVHCNQLTSHTHTQKKKDSFSLCWLPKSAESRLLFSKNSYTKIRWVPSTQHPINSTRFRCLTFAIAFISAKNSRTPCFDSALSAFTAICVPLLRIP